MLPSPAMSARHTHVMNSERNRELADAFYGKVAKTKPVATYRIDIAGIVMDSHQFAIVHQCKATGMLGFQLVPDFFICLSVSLQLFGNPLFVGCRCHCFPIRQGIGVLLRRHLHPIEKGTLDNPTWPSRASLNSFDQQPKLDDTASSDHASCLFLQLIRSIGFAITVPACELGHMALHVLRVDLAELAPVTPLSIAGSDSMPCAWASPLTRSPSTCHIASWSRGMPRQAT